MKDTNSSTNNVCRNNLENTPEPEVDTQCGYGRCKLNFLQKFNNPKFLLVLLCIYSFSQGFSVSGVHNVNTQTLERRFKLPSSQSGMISSSYDFSAAVFGVIISFIGSGRYKARWLACGAFVMGIGSLVMAIPHFTTGPYEWGEDRIKTCNINGSSSVEEVCVSSGLQSYLGVLMFSMILHGIGGTTLYTVGVGLLDDSVPATSSPLYLDITAYGVINFGALSQFCYPYFILLDACGVIAFGVNTFGAGILYGILGIGPGLGYIIGGQMLNIYVDFDVVDLNTIELTPSDPRWVGAWWLSFFVTFTTCVLIAVPLSCYGAELPTAENVRKTRQSEMHKGNETKLSSVSADRLPIRQFPTVILALLRNPPFLFTVLAGASEGILTSGFATFVPKFIQNHFGVTAARAALYTGIAAIPGTAGGFFLGGFICNRMKLKVAGILKFAIITCSVSLLFTTLVWVSCDADEMAGVNHPYKDSSQTSLHDVCNAGCQCSTEFYDPVCDENGTRYFSSCHAGCAEVSSDGESYFNCSCVNVGAGDNVSMATTGTCQTGCGLMYLFLVMLFIIIFLTFLPTISSISALLRCIHEDHRTFGMGIKWLVVRLLGTVPGPVIFGAVTDTACLVWQTECGESSSCWIYDNFAISRNYFLIAMSVKCLSIVFFSIAFCTYKPPVGAEEKYSKEAYSKKENGHMNFGFNEDTDKNLKNTDDVKNVSHTVSEEEAESITTTRI